MSNAIQSVLVENRVFEPSAEIVKAAKETGLQLDKFKVLLPEPIRELGEFEIPVQVYPKVTATLKVLVVEEA